MNLQIAFYPLLQNCTMKSVTLNLDDKQLRKTRLDNRTERSNLSFDTQVLEWP